MAWLKWTAFENHLFGSISWISWLLFVKCKYGITLYVIKDIPILQMPTPHLPNSAVRKALRKLGTNIHEARMRRKLPMSVVAERASTSRPTLSRLEKGDPSVSIGIYAAVLQALGLLEDLSLLADPARDSVGQQLMTAALPRRARLSGRKPKGGDA
jgi:hypothetical protein